MRSTIRSIEPRAVVAQSLPPPPPSDPSMRQRRNSVAPILHFALEYDDDYHQINTSFQEYVQRIDKKLSNDTPNELSTPCDMMAPLNDTPLRSPTEDDSSFKWTSAKSPTLIEKSVYFSNLITIDYYPDSTTAKDTPVTLSKLNCNVQLYMVSFLTAEEV